MMPKLTMQEMKGFSQKIETIANSGKPYTIKLRIDDVKGNAYLTEFDILKGGFDAESQQAVQKGVTLCLGKCEAVPKSVTFLDVVYKVNPSNN